MINHPIVSIDFGKSGSGVTEHEIGHQPLLPHPKAKPKLRIDNVQSAMENRAIRRQMMNRG